MCGLLGAIADRDVTPILIQGLKRLEYRGYDSAGLALANGVDAFSIHRCVGKVRDLEAQLTGSAFLADHGIGHTRWATHGVPSERNAHPHVSHQQIAVVHNGIIENHRALRQELERQGYEFQSETDSEVIAHLVHHQAITSGDGLLAAVHRAVRQLEGSYALAAVSVADRESLVVARSGSPIVVGLGDGALYAASDAAALLPWTNRFIFLEDGDVAELRRNNLSILDASGNEAVRSARELNLSDQATEKGGYRHYMLKEIFEQPRALMDTFRGRSSHGVLQARQLGFMDPQLLDEIQEIQIVACGTSYYASEVGRHWLESLAGIPCRIELASEFRYRAPMVPPHCLFVALSQSGETADTLAALRYAKQAGYMATMAICNVPESSLTREADITLLTHAGPEIGVASTKAFTTQLMALLLLTVLLGRRRWSDSNRERMLVRDLGQAGHHVEQALRLNERIRALAEQFVSRRHALILGRGPMYAIAKEGALKLKETSYIHAEAYAAGELKHGPLALVDEDMPVLALAPCDGYLEKLESNLQEVRARGGRLYVFTDPDNSASSMPDRTTVTVPKVPELLTPLVYAVIMQLLAYHVAALKGTDIDQPRNLAKSVTVE